MDSLSALKLYDYLNVYLLKDISKIICEYILTQIKNMHYDVENLIELIPTERKNYLCSVVTDYNDDDCITTEYIYYGSIKYIVSKLDDFLELSALQIDYNLYQFEFFANKITIGNVIVEKYRAKIYCNNENNMKKVGKLLIKYFTKAKKDTKIKHINEILFDNEEKFELLKFFTHNQFYRTPFAYGSCSLKEFADKIHEVYREHKIYREQEIEQENNNHVDECPIRFSYSNENIMNVIIKRNKVRLSIRLRQNNKAQNLSDLQNLINENCSESVMETFANFLKQSNKNCPHLINKHINNVSMKHC